MDNTIALSPCAHLSTVQRAIFDLSTHATEQALLSEFEGVIELMKIEWYHYSGDFAARGDSEILKIFSNLPHPWKDSLLGAGLQQSTPLLRYIHHRTAPVIFNDFVELADNWCDSHIKHEIFNLGGGVIFPIHGESGNCAAICFLTKNDENGTHRTISPLLGDMALAAMHFHEAMSRIIAKSHHVLKAPLTEREVECLRLIARRKSNWAIAKIFDISIDGVSYYVRRLMWKLDAYDRHHAVERATAYGLI